MRSPSGWAEVPCARCGARVAGLLDGNKSVLFNAEYILQVAGPVRLVMFYDAGQVRDIGEKFGMMEDILEVVPPPQPQTCGAGSSCSSGNAECQGRCATSAGVSTCAPL